MKNFTKCTLVFFLSWNMLLFGSVESRATGHEFENPQNSESSDVGPPKYENQDSTPQSEPNDNMLNDLIKMMIPQILKSLNNADGPMQSENNPQQDFSQSQNNPSVESTSSVNSAQQTNLAQNTSAPDEGSDSLGITIIPLTQDNSSQDTSNPTTSTALVPVQQQETAPAGPNSTSNVQDEDEATAVENNSTTADQQPINQNQTVDSQPTKLELNQITSSQILYHLKMQYEDYLLQVKQGDSVETYEITQKTFLREMLGASKKVTSAINKNVVSTTYAAYYSAEYTYTFALCKLHHITKGSEDPQNPIHADISSNCSKIMETFSSFNTSYKEIISEATSSEGIDNEDGQIDSNSKSDDEKNLKNSNSSNQKISTSNDETIQRKALEKDLRGYDDDHFFNRVIAEGNVLDQFDLKQSQQIGDSTHSQETKGQKSNSTDYLLSEVREIPKDKSLDDPANGEMRQRRMSNILRTDSEADTKGHTENNDVVVDSDHLQKYKRTQQRLDEFERNVIDDNSDIGGNIENAKLQDVQSHYFAEVEHTLDVNEQETKPKTHETVAKKYTFRQAVEQLTSYIRILHVFIGDMENNVEDSKNSSDDGGKDAYDEMHQSIYQQTFTCRQYLKEYFASTNVESGTFGGNGNKTLDTVEMETESLQTTVEKRFLWLKNADQQGQADSKSASSPDAVKSNPIQLLWYFEEASFYYEHVQQSQTNVPFMSYLPYPNYDVKADSDGQDGADIQFYFM